MKGTTPHGIDANRLADKAWNAIAHLVVDPVWFAADFAKQRTRETERRMRAADRDGAA